MFNNISHTQTQQEDDTLWKTQLNMPSVGEFFPHENKRKRRVPSREPRESSEMYTDALYMCRNPGSYQRGVK